MVLCIVLKIQCVLGPGSSFVSMSFKNYSSTPGSIMFSSHGCLEGLTDS